jgi:DNA-binding HxlR family transcriptional regulator/putative sterol carrier protein
MTKRSYEQYCPLASALDLLGERWTLLVIRELLWGPQRYTDLVEALPGIGTNLLAGRLRDLESAGVVRRRTLPPPAASAVYELSEHGERLREPLMALAKWGIAALPPIPKLTSPEQMAGFPVRSMVFGLACAIDEHNAGDLDATYVLWLDEEPHIVRVTHGAAEVRRDVTDSADAVLRLEAWSFLRIALGELTPADAEAEGGLRIEGDRVAAERLLALMDFRELLADVGSLAGEAQPAAASAS